MSYQDYQNYDPRENYTEYDPRFNYRESDPRETLRELGAGPDRYSFRYDPNLGFGGMAEDNNIVLGDINDPKYSDEERAFLLAHELGHNRLGHSQQGRNIDDILFPTDKEGRPVLSAASSGNTFVPMGRKFAEKEADKYAVEALRNTKYDNENLTLGLDRQAARENKNPLALGSLDPRETHFSMQDRADYIKKLRGVSSASISQPSYIEKKRIPSAKLSTEQFGYDTIEAPDPIAVGEQQLIEAKDKVKAFFKDPVQNNVISQILNSKQEKVPPAIRDIKDTRQAIGRQVVRQLLGPIPTALDSLQGDQTIPGGFMGGLNQGLTAGFSDELQAGLDTVGDLLSGSYVKNKDKGVIDTAIDQYRVNRDIRRENLSRQQASNPGSFASGQLVGGLPWMALFKGSPGQQVLTGTAIGGTQGLGYSEADLTKAAYGQSIEDTMTGAALMGALLGTGSTLNKLGRWIKPRNLDEIAAHQRIAGGGTAQGAPGFGHFKEGELPPSIRGYKLAEENGMIQRNGNLVTNKDFGSSPSVQQMLDDPKSAFLAMKNNPPTGKQLKTRAKDSFNSIFSNQSEIDYDKLRSNVNDYLVKGRQDKLQLLSPIVKKEYTWDQALGSNPTSTMLRTANAIRNAEQNAATFGTNISDDEIASLQYLKNHLSKEKVSMGQLEETSRNLGILTRKFYGKELPEGSPQKILKDTKLRIDRQIEQELENYKSGLGQKYKQKNIDLHDMSEFADTVAGGHDKFLRQHGASDLFEKGGLSRTLLDGSAPTPGTSVMNLLGNLFSKGEGIVGGSAQIASKLFSPPSSMWISQIFQSYNDEDGVLFSPRDRELYNHYVDLSNLNSREKAKLKMAVNTKGKFNPNIIPNKIKDSARKKAIQVFEAENNALMIPAPSELSSPIMPSMSSPPVPPPQTRRAPFDVYDYVPFTPNIDSNSDSFKLSSLISKTGRGTDDSSNRRSRKPPKKKHR